MMKDSSNFYTFYDVQNEANDYFANRDKGRGSGYKQYVKWEIFAEPRFSPSGNIFNIPATNLNNYQSYLNSFNFNTLPSNYDPGYFTPIANSGLHNLTNGWNGGTGRVNTIAFSSNGNHCFVGTPAGGVWKSGGTGVGWTDWMPIADGLPHIGISGIAVNPNNSDNIFLLTGDGDGANTPSIGVVKSEDGGLTWEATSLLWTASQGVRARRLLMHPTNPDIQFVVVSGWTGTTIDIRGMYKTIDGWDSWTKVFSGGLHDIKFKPLDPSIVYATSSNDFYMSTSNGDSATFNEVTNGLPVNPATSRIIIGVSPDDPSTVYLLYGGSVTGSSNSCTAASSPFVGLYRSTDPATTAFTLQSSGCPNILGYEDDGEDERGQNGYDLAIAISPTDIDEVHVGGINCWKSLSAGATGSWTITSHWREDGLNGGGVCSGTNSGTGNTIGYTHADIHTLEYHPTNGALYCGSDGGFYRYDGSTWADRSAGLQIMQFYDIDLDVNATVLIGGTQDNGTNSINLSTEVINHDLGADGFNCLVDPTDGTNWFMTMNSALYYTSNSGATFSCLSPGGRIATRAFEMHPTNNQILYAGVANDFRTSSDGGSSWNDVAPTVLTTGMYIAATYGVSNTNRIYTTTQGGRVFVTSNAGGTWNDVTNDLNSVSNHTDIALNPNDSKDSWVTISGYTSGDKVWYSSDVGVSWTNISGSLPNVPVNCVVIDPNRTDHSVYIGTDIGVFYRDDNLSDWVPFFHGLPNTEVFDLEIENNELFVGTYGRGIWKSKLYGNCFSTITLGPVGNPAWSSSYSNLPQYYAASDWIKSERTIHSSIGDSVRYQGGNYVELLPGFNTQSGANFKANIGQCDPNTSSSSSASYMSAQDAIIYRCYGTLVP